MKTKMSLVLAGASALCFMPLHAAPEPISSVGPNVAAQAEIKKIEQERNEALQMTTSLENHNSEDNICR